MENIEIGSGKLMMSAEDLPPNIQKLAQQVESGDITAREFTEKVKPLGYNADFDMSGELTEIYQVGTKNSQQSIRLTPEIKAKIQGKELPLKKPSGRLPIYGVK